MFKISTKASTVFSAIVSIAISFVNGLDENAIVLLNTIVDHQAEPTNVFIKSCWPLHIEADILRKTTMQIGFIEDFTFELPVDLSPNNVMFVTSLDCVNTNEFVAGVR